MSYLNDPRVLFAAERTLLAWQRTSITLMALGFVVERFGLFLRMVSTSTAGATTERGLSLWVGVTLLILAITSAIVSALQYRRVVRTLAPAEIPRDYWIGFAPAVNYVLATIGLVLVAYFVSNP